jgi:hypothetical protein
VDDLEARAVEALDLFQVTREPARDGDVRVREAGDRAVAERKAAVLTELVEAVLRRHAHRHSRQRASQLPVHIGVHQVRVQDVRTRAREISGDAEKRDRVDVCSQRDGIQGNAAGA